MHFHVAFKARKDLQHFSPQLSSLQEMFLMLFILKSLAIFLHFHALVRKVKHYFENENFHFLIQEITKCVNSTISYCDK